MILEIHFIIIIVITLPRTGAELRQTREAFQCSREINQSDATDTSRMDCYYKICYCPNGMSYYERDQGSGNVTVPPLARLSNHGGGDTSTCSARSVQSATHVSSRRTKVLQVGAHDVAQCTAANCMRGDQSQRALSARPSTADQSAPATTYRSR